MLKNEERIVEVKRRIEEKERQQRLRHRRIVYLLYLADAGQSAGHFCPD